MGKLFRLGDFGHERCGGRSGRFRMRANRLESGHNITCKKRIAQRKENESADGIRTMSLGWGGRGERLNPGGPASHAADGL